MSFRFRNETACRRLTMRQKKAAAAMDDALLANSPASIEHTHVCSGALPFPSEL